MKIERALALAAVALLALAAAVAAAGSVQLDRGTAGAAPAWSSACARKSARPDRTRLARCARVSGRVVWIRRHGAETHLAVVARLHLFVVKLPPGASAPGPGSAVTTIGPLVRARNGLREVQAFALWR